jgi:L,D-peptidoglycan transpeptidase YkuD (ErfK/YbiS/YcfS/YnhG family)
MQGLQAPRYQPLAVAVMLAGWALVACAGPSRAPLATGTTTSAATSTTTTAAVSLTTSTSAAPPPATITTVTRSPAPVATTTHSAVAATTTPCPSTLAGQLASTGGGSQLITVVANTTGSTSATITLWQRTGSCWTQAGGPWTGRVGRNGMSGHHREGDGTTPMGLYGLSSTFYGIASNPGVHGSYHPLVCGDWWDEDPASPQYNTFQHVACGTTPAFGGGSEALWQQKIAYQNFAVVEYNAGPIVPGAGSAIFFHDDTGGGTNGCISLPPPELNTVFRWLQPGQSPHIAIGTGATIRGS